MHALREGNTLYVVISPTLTPKLKFKFCLFQQMNELLWKQQFDSVEQRILQIKITCREGKKARIKPDSDFAVCKFFICPSFVGVRLSSSPPPLGRNIFLDTWKYYL